MRPFSASSKRQRPGSSKSPSPHRTRGGLLEDLDGQQLLQEALGRAAPRLLIESLHISNLDLRLDVHLLHGPAQLPFAVDTSMWACVCLNDDSGCLSVSTTCCHVSAGLAGSPPWHHHGCTARRSLNHLGHLTVCCSLHPGLSQQPALPQLSLLLQVSRACKQSE